MQGKSRCLDGFPAGSPAGHGGGRWPPACCESISGTGRLPSRCQLCLPAAGAGAVEELGSARGRTTGCHQRHLQRGRLLARGRQLGRGASSLPRMLRGGGRGVCCSWGISRPAEGEAVEQRCSLSAEFCLVHVSLGSALRTCLNVPGAARLCLGACSPCQLWVSQHIPW